MAKCLVNLVAVFVARASSSCWSSRWSFSNVKGVGSGVLEYRIDFGPGYRIYFGKDGDVLVILLGGGTKKGQQHDIAAAHARWKDYKQRKPREK
jgi:phage-related protein